MTEKTEEKGLRAKAPITVGEAKMLNALALAYIGDAVFETYVREIIVLSDESGKVHVMHRKATGVVNARMQAHILEKIAELLSEDEIYIVKRGRNAKPHSVPKNADVMDYKAATAFEALLGYLYLTGEEKRLSELLKLSCEIVGLA